MTYRGSMPPGQAYPGQAPLPPPQVNYHAYVNGNPASASYPAPAPLYAAQPAPYYAVGDASQIPAYDGSFNPSASLPHPPVAVREPLLPQQAQPPIQASYQTPSPTQRFIQGSKGPQPIPSTHYRSTTPQERPPSQASRPRPSPGNGSRKSSSSAITKLSTTSPSPSPHIDNLAVLVCVAEDCFAKAAGAVKLVAKSQDDNATREYHKLIATGLGCLEAAIQSCKLSPRAEARIRLRYAAVLVEETENLMEAETALTKGIATCEKHRLIDLKYCMQFLLIKMLFRRNKPKAALIAIDSSIADSKTYKHIHWVYAFRFLKASFFLQSGNPSDNHAIENLRGTAEIASRRGDNAICVLLSLLEGLTHMMAMKEDTIVRVQTCIAQVSKYQLDESVHLPQIDVLLSLLDLACSLHQKTPAITAQKMTALQTTMDSYGGEEWSSATTELLLPIKKMDTMSQTISSDTTAILRPGNGTSDFLVLSIFGKPQAYALGYAFCGLAALYKSSTLGKSSMYWRETLSVLDQAKQAKKKSGLSLRQAVEQEQWESSFRSYVNVLLGLQAATLSDWGQVRECVTQVANPNLPSTGSLQAALSLYLAGVYHQGTGDLDSALRVFEDKRFSLDSGTNPLRSVKPAETGIAILAALNRLWIMQLPARTDQSKIAKLREQLQPLCESHPDPEIRTAYNLVEATLQSAEGASINQVKRYIQQALQYAQLSSNAHCLSIALNVMRWKLFEKVVGEQALKSAKAAQAQARKGGNLLWMSVADGLLSESYDTQGWANEAHTARETGTQLANEAFRKTLS